MSAVIKKLVGCAFCASIGLLLIILACTTQGLVNNERFVLIFRDKTRVFVSAFFRKIQFNLAFHGLKFCAWLL